MDTLKELTFSYDMRSAQIVTAVHTDCLIKVRGENKGGERLTSIRLTFEQIFEHLLRAKLILDAQRYWVNMFLLLRNLHCSRRDM